MLATQASDSGETGSLDTSRRQALSAGNSEQPAMVGPAATGCDPTVVGATAGLRVVGVTGWAVVLVAKGAAVLVVVANELAVLDVVDVDVDTVERRSVAV
jgi:hypothetical protein